VHQPCGEPAGSPIERPATTDPPPTAGAAGLGRPPAAAGRIFGDRLSHAEAYAELLATDGVARGLVGPREVSRLWDRHLLNCAVVAELIPAGSGVVDVGSGAGLPGIPLALARPDLSVTLLEPSLRRSDFLIEVLALLGLNTVVVHRRRAEEGAPAPAAVVTARAVAPLQQLVAWCLPWVAAGGRLLAIKGDTAPAEVAASTAAVRSAGGQPAALRRCGVGLVDPPTTVVEIARAPAAGSVRGIAAGSRLQHRRG